jgi:uncharacterized protein (TIGR03435 family)
MTGRTNPWRESCRSFFRNLPLHVVVLVSLGFQVPKLKAQTTADSQAKVLPSILEEATIKPVKDPDPNRTRDTTEGRRLYARNLSLRELITMAYKVDPKQIEGGPKWLATEAWDIDAEAVEGVNLHDEREEETLLREILADRFRLAFHRAKKTLPVYVLTIAKNGPKLQAADPNEGENSGCPQPGVCTFKKRTLSNFAWYMQYVVLDRPVVDKTGIAGQFDFSLKWAPDESQFSRLGWMVKQPEDSSVPPLFVAMQEQLGLKLESVNAPVDVLIVDHVERPSAN